MDERFIGGKARAFVALVVYPGWLQRGWGRLKGRVKTMQAEDHVGLPAVEQRARINWPARTFTLSYWNEFGGDKEALLAGLMDFLLPQKYFVVPDTGWSKWDLKISRGLWSRAFVTVCAETHGGSKRLLRVRCAMRMSSLARVLLRSCAILTAAGLILESPVAAVIFFAIGVVNLGVAGWHLVIFGRLMHRIIEAVARHPGLMPGETINRSPPPHGAPPPISTPAPAPARLPSPGSPHG